MSLGASVAPSPARSPARGSLLTIKPIFVVTCRWPAPLHPVASKGMVNQAFSCAEACWACSTALLTPLRLPEGSQLSGASRKLWFCTPCCCVIPMPWFFFLFFFFSSAVARWTAQPNKLMSQNVSTLRTHCTARRELDSRC